MHRQLSTRTFSTPTPNKYKDWLPSPNVQPPLSTYTPKTPRDTPGSNLRARNSSRRMSTRLGDYSLNATESPRPFPSKRVQVYPPACTAKTENYCSFCSNEHFGVVGVNVGEYSRSLDKPVGSDDAADLDESDTITITCKVRQITRLGHV